LIRQGIGMKEQKTNNMLIAAIAIITILVLFNQWQISQVSLMMQGGGGHQSSGVFSAVSTKSISLSTGDLEDVDIDSIQSTAQAVAAVMSLDAITDAQSAINIMIPTGTPEYGEAMGVSYDDPIGGMELLARAWRPLSEDAKTNDPETWDRFITLATKPVGISCEFCCGVGPSVITQSGQLKCGCKHSPAIVALTLWLMQNTDMTDAEVLQEALRWKTLWFPRDMVGIGMQLAGGDTSILHDIPGMVGGC